MYEAKVKLTNEVGLHARPASLFIQEAVKYSSDIEVIKDNKTYNGKSIMGILSMGASKGEEITIRAYEDDKEEAVKALIDIVNNKLKEY